MNQSRAEIDAVHAKANAELDVLSWEYLAWNKAQGLNLGSADEHWFDENLTPEQRRWIIDYSRRWELARPVIDSGVWKQGRDC